MAPECASERPKNKRADHRQMQLGMLEFSNASQSRAPAVQPRGSLRTSFNFLEQLSRALAWKNAFVWIPDSKTSNGIAEAPLTDIAVRGFREQTGLAGNSLWLFLGENPGGRHKSLKTVWHALLRSAKAHA
jgi:hypothetical protein